MNYEKYEQDKTKDEQKNRQGTEKGRPEQQRPGQGQKDPQKEKKSW